MGFDPEDVKFVLLDLAEVVMPEVGEKLGNSAKQVLRKRGINVRHPDVFAAGDAAAVPDLTQPGKITPPTAQHAIRQGKVLARNVAASLGYGKLKDYRHRNMGLVVDLGPHYAVESAERSPFGLPRKVCDSHVPPVRDPALRQSLGGVAGVSDRRVL